MGSILNSLAVFIVQNLILYLLLFQIACSKIQSIDLLPHQNIANEVFLSNATTSSPGTITTPFPPKSLHKPSYGGNYDSRSRRRKRKVISRGGHYIIRSKTGGSPWGSPRVSTGSFSNWRNKRKHLSNGGWNLRDNLRISKENFALDASGGSRYSSGTLRRYRHSIRRPKERKTISRALKFEIAQYALRNGAKRTSERYESEVGRKLKERVVEKFARRYVKRSKRKRPRRYSGSII